MMAGPSQGKPDGLPVEGAMPPITGAVEWLNGPPLSAEQLEKKLAALACYPSEVQPWPHPRSALGVRNLAALRGQQVGVERAEAFCLLRRGPC